MIVSGGQSVRFQQREGECDTKEHADADREVRHPSASKGRATQGVLEVARVENWIEGSSLVAIKAIAEGTMPALHRQRFGVADVRDVADAHLKAAATPDAANTASGVRHERPHRVGGCLCGPFGRYF